jgi:hypothetical protein
MKFSLEEQFEGFIRTPQIFAENAIFEYPLYQTPEITKAKNPGEISAPKQSVLGKRMEHFFAFYVSHFTSEEILVQNRQIIEDKTTRGELDFLLKDSASGIISHIELIYKFYLFDLDSGASELDHLIGPNKRDSLNKKLERLQKKQFPLLFKEATQSVLTSLDIDTEHVVQKMCFKASVFLPKQMKKISFDHINPETIAGYWIKASEFTFETYGKNSFVTPTKKYWPVSPQQNEKWFSYDEIEEQIHTLLERKFSPLLWMKTPRGELERFFIVWW